MLQARLDRLADQIRFDLRDDNNYDRGRDRDRY
jgi:hypothetical protein